MPWNRSLFCGCVRLGVATLCAVRAADNIQSFMWNFCSAQIFWFNVREWVSKSTNEINSLLVYSCSLAVVAPKAFVKRFTMLFPMEHPVNVHKNHHILWKTTFLRRIVLQFGLQTNNRIDISILNRNNVKIHFTVAHLLHTKANDDHIACGNMLKMQCTNVCVNIVNVRELNG